MRHRITILTLVASLLLIAQPAGATTNLVSGSQALASPGDAAGAACIANDPVAGGSPFIFTMSGSLNGCWYAVDFIDKFQDNGTLQETGHEVFVGCLDRGGDGSCSGDPTGTLSFWYVFTAKFDPVTFDEIKGRCHHLVYDGSGDFEGASGIVNFKDDVVAEVANYFGTIKLASSTTTSKTRRSTSRQASAPGAAC